MGNRGNPILYLLPQRSVWFLGRIFTDQAIFVFNEESEDDDESSKEGSYHVYTEPIRKMTATTNHKRSLFKSKNID